MSATHTLITNEQFEQCKKILQSLKRIELETDELKLYLDRPEPNVGAALRRVQDIKDIINGARTIRKDSTGKISDSSISSNNVSKEIE